MALVMWHVFLLGCDARMWSCAGPSIVDFPHGEQSYHKGQIFTPPILSPDVPDELHYHPPQNLLHDTPIPRQWGSH